jgi:hypothetical protein
LACTAHHTTPKLASSSTKARTSKEHHSPPPFWCVRHDDSGLFLELYIYAIATFI